MDVAILVFYTSYKVTVLLLLRFKQKYLSLLRIKASWLIKGGDGGGYLLFLINTCISINQKTFVIQTLPDF